MKSGGRNFPSFMVFTAFNLLFFMVAYYTLRHLQIPKLFNTGRTALFLMSVVLSSFAITACWYLTAQLFNSNYYHNLDSFFTECIQMYTPAVALLALDSYYDRLQEQERMEQLEQEKMKQELKFLKAQLNPHFLFNTLNNLYSFVITESSKAPDVVKRLSGILDYAINKSQESAVLLSEEVAAIENFLGLEQIRYGDRLLIDYQKKGDLLLSVSPLILLSIVENAFKHGASGDIDQPKIKIDIRGEESTIYCNVWNTKSQYNGSLNDEYKEGIGLSNIMRQLRLVYPNQHQLSITEEKTTYNIALTIETKSLT